MLERPGDFDLMFAFAQEATARGDYGAAISTYERMLLFAPDLPRIRLELGALYFRMGALEIARDYLAEVDATPDLPPGVRMQVADMLAAIERGSKVNTDLSDKWDYWAWIETPIDEVRQKLNILPKAAVI
jgi:tetratricopeptide (TPR) repeat protein